MKLRNLTGAKSPPKKELIEGIKTSRGIVDFTPTFNNGDTVCLKKEFIEYSLDLQYIVATPLLVDKCKVADLGDMVIEVLYLQETSELIRNPYLVEHFEVCK